MIISNISRSKKLAKTRTIMNAITVTTSKSYVNKFELLMNLMVERVWKKKAQETKPLSNFTSGASKSCDCIRRPSRS